MLKLLGPHINNPVIACSGGVDSMAAVDFYLNKGKGKPHLAFFNHGTKTSEIAQQFLEEYSKKYQLPLFVGTITQSKAKEESWEEYWRNQRYGFLRSTFGDRQIVMCHHLDDVIENWIFNALNGEPRLIPYCNGNIVRPFLLTRKEELRDWCKRKSVPWVEDESNNDTRFARNRIRHNIVPEALQINPGLHKVIARKVQEAYDRDFSHV